jgi:hypothetical protein
MDRALRIGIIGSLLILAACSDDIAGPDATGDVAARKQAASGATPEQVAVDRFAIALDVEGSFRPGDPIDVTFAVSALYDSPAAVVALRMPDVVHARANGWSGVQMRPGMRFEPVLEVREVMAAGSRVERRATVTIAKPGYYRIIVAADAPGASNVLATGGFIHNSAYAEAWVLIDEGGGGTTSTYEPALLGDSVAPQPGPRQLRRRSRDAAGAVPSMSSMTALTPGMVTGYAVYHHPITGEVLPVPGLKIESCIYDSYEDNCYGGYDPYTDATGYFELWCPTEYTQRLDFEARYRSAAVVNYNPIGGYQMWSTDCANGADGSFNLVPHEAHAFVTLNRVAAASTSLFGVSRQPVDLRFWTENKSYYNRGWSIGPWGEIDHIQLSIGAVFTDFGFFTMAHEFGHAMLHRALGGSPDIPDSCKEHDFSTVEAATCAFSEGFADYYAVATLGEETGELFYLEHNLYYFAGQDGSRKEHSVAAFLWDLTDPANEAHDQVQYPGTYIAGILRTCDVAPKTGGYFDRNRLEHVIYCLERQVDASVRPRFTDPWILSIGFQRESAVEPPTWSRPAIRTLWMRNLYGL